MHLPTPVGISVWTRCAYRTAFAAAVLAAGCQSSCCYAPPQPAPVVPLAMIESSSPASVTMQIIPGNVFAIRNEPFEMRVRLADAAGNALAESSASQVKWSVTPAGATVGPSPGARTIVKIGAPGVAVFTLTASHPTTGVVATAVIHVVDLEQPQTQDWIAASHVANAPPTFALVDGMAATFTNDELIAFVGAAPVGTLRSACSPANAAECGEVTVFSTTHALGRSKFLWTDPSCDIADRRDTALTPACHPVVTGPLGGPTAVVLNTWVFAPLATLALVQADIDYATRVLANSWSGLSVIATVTETGETASVLLDTPNDVCKPSVRQSLDVLGVTGFGPNTVTLVIVPVIMGLKDGNPVPGSIVGYSCPASDADGAIVVVAWALKRYTTLAHELGHALGPWSKADAWGHVDGLAGFNTSNLMSNSHSYAVLAPRSALTLGQVFRFSLDKDALVRRLGGGTFDRCDQSATTGTPCPMIGKDVRP